MVNTAGLVLLRFRHKRITPLLSKLFLYFITHILITKLSHHNSEPNGVPQDLPQLKSIDIIHRNTVKDLHTLFQNIVIKNVFQ